MGINFDGRLTAWVRRRLRQRRLEMQLSISAISAQFHIHSSAWRRWECGLSRRCQPRYILTLQRFLNDSAPDVDAGIKEEKNSVNTPVQSLLLSAGLSRLASLYLLCDPPGKRGFYHRDFLRALKKLAKALQAKYAHPRRVFKNR